jgi:transposase-like protein
MEQPSTLQEAIVYFADPETCNDFLAGLRWTDGKVLCPYCGSEKVFYLASQNRYKCYGKHPKSQFSLKVGTIFEDSSISLDKWLCAVWLVVNCKNGISSCEMARSLGVTQKSAWFMNHRIRMALHDGSIGKASGHIEADETFIGGNARNMHIAQRRRRITGTGGKDKTPVLGIMQRGGKVRTVVVPNGKEKILQTKLEARRSRFCALHRFPFLVRRTRRRVRPQGHGARRTVPTATYTPIRSKTTSH